ncbi:MAG: phosphatidate cytidylyltransferase [Saprospiraceae bacterium]
MNKFNTLNTRIITAIFFGIIVIALLNINYITLSIFLLLTGFLTSLEFYKIKGLFNSNQTYIIIAAILTGVFPGLFQIWFSVLNDKWFILLLILVIIYSIIKVLDLYFNFKNEDSNNISILGEGILYIGIPIRLILYVIRPEDFILHKLIFILILLIWANDSFAYFAGNLFGKRKLMPSVSPKKTIEGLIGGAVMTLVTAIILYFIFNIFDIYFFIITAIIVSVAGTYGDLVESKLKRNYNIKDSGNLLPGHGGFLDRFDSFIYTLPYYALLLAYYIK